MSASQSAGGTPAPIVVCALYKFVSIPHFETLRDPLLEQLKSLSIRGTLLLAHEGINGTVAGSRPSIDALLDWLRGIPEFAELDYKESFTDEQPFLRTKVKLKKEIVTMGIEDVDPNRVVGTYVEPKDWNALISDPEVLLIDTRNDYEFQVGTFQHAVNPNTDSFRQFPEYVSENLDPEKHKRVAMFCTGGIRCEKSTAYLKQQGFDEVYHLKGGILNYFAEVEEGDSLWNGECFVFDDRVTVDQQLQKGNYDQCHACRMPITEDDKASDDYEQGVSCPHCVDKTTDRQRQRFSEREKQIQLAKVRGQSHIGTEVVDQVEQRRQQKQAYREAQQARHSGRSKTAK